MTISREPHIQSPLLSEWLIWGKLGLSRHRWTLRIKKKHCLKNTSNLGSRMHSQSQPKLMESWHTCRAYTHSGKELHRSMIRIGSYMNSLKIMPKFQSLTRIKAIRDILMTIAICDQHKATWTLGQARKPLVHDNICWHKLEKLEVNSRNRGSFWYAISDKVLIAYCQVNPSKKEKPQAPKHKKL